MIRPTLICSQKFYDEIKTKYVDAGRRMIRLEDTSPGGIVTFSDVDLYGIYLRVSPMLPCMIPKGRVVSLDRFATYEPADMWYAEPLKLARWEPTETHAVWVKEPVWPLEMRGIL